MKWQKHVFSRSGSKYWLSKTPFGDYYIYQRARGGYTCGGPVKTNNQLGELEYVGGTHFWKLKDAKIYIEKEFKVNVSECQKILSCS